MEFEEGDIVLCTVEKIVGTVVSVKIEDNGEGNIIMSEIAPGRIRNLRDYVVPKKKIVCKILRIRNNNIDLSLRRVTLKEKKEVLEREKQEKSYKSILKSVLKEKTNEIIEEISKQDKIFPFLEEAKQDSKKLEKITGKADAEKILEILNSQKIKKAIIKKEFSFTTTEPNGLEIIKELLGNEKHLEIKYLSAGNYSIKKESENAKTADQEIRNFLSELEKQAKKKAFTFAVKEKN
jgi:translation initiation factor 2 alpha subunit (eIF-2alpha)